MRDQGQSLDGGFSQSQPGATVDAAQPMGAQWPASDLLTAPEGASVAIDSDGEASTRDF